MTGGECGVTLSTNEKVVRSLLGKKARAYAVANLERDVVLAKFEADLLACVR